MKITIMLPENHLSTYRTPPEEAHRLPCQGQATRTTGHQVHLGILVGPDILGDDPADSSRWRDVSSPEGGRSLASRRRSV